MCIWHTPQWRLESELTEGRVGEFGMDMCTLPCLKWITSEDPLCSSVLCVAWMVKGLVWVWLSPFTIHLNYHSTVNRLYPNTKKKKKNREERTDLQCELLNFSPYFLLLLWSLRDWCSPGLPASWHPCTPVSSYSESHDNLCYIYVCIYSLQSELLGVWESLLLYLASTQHYFLHTGILRKCWVEC